MSCFGLPMLGYGLGLRTAHYSHLLEHSPPVDWLEIISENYMGVAGRPLSLLERIADRYPLVMHGVSLSIGSTAPLDWDYLRALKQLRDRVGAQWVSDHLCWTGVAGLNTHDLLPVPYTEESLVHIVGRVRQVQDFLEAPLVLENPSTYLEHASSTFTEWEFLRVLAQEANCGLLLDVNNVYVSAFNHGFDPSDYLQAMPWERVVQIHIAGHTQYPSHIIDSHIGPVPSPVLELLRAAHGAGANASVLLEWDAEIPPFEVAHADLLRAKAFVESSGNG